MNFSEYWKAEAAKRRKKWASRAKSFAYNYSQMEEIRKEVYTKLNHYDYHQYIETHYAKKNPIAVWEQMQFHFSESGLRGALEAECDDLRGFNMEISYRDITTANLQRPEFFPSEDEWFFRKISTMLTDVNTVRITLGQVKMTINRYCTKDSPFAFYGLNFGEQLMSYAILLQETEFNMLNVATLLLEMAAEMDLRDEELNYYAKKMRIRKMEAAVADDNIEFALWDDKKLEKKVAEYIAKGYTISQVINQVLRPYKSAVNKFFSIATELSLMTQNDRMYNYINYSDNEYWVKQHLRPHLNEAGMQDVDVSITKHTTVLTKQGYSCCFENTNSGRSFIFSPNAGYDNFSIDISTRTPVSAIVNFLRHMPTINSRIDEYLVKALQIYDKQMCRQNEEYNKIVEHLAALSAQYAGKPVGKLMKYLRWSAGKLMKQKNVYIHTIAVTGDTSFSFTERVLKSFLPPATYEDELNEKWVDAECRYVYSADPGTTNEQEWLKATRRMDTWNRNQDMRSFAGHGFDETFLTVDFINEKL